MSGDGRPSGPGAPDLAGLRVCLLTDQDLEQDPFPVGDWPCDPRPFLPEADWTLAVLDKAGAVSRVQALAREGFDLFFNLCDGAWEEGRPGIEVVQTLERLGCAFTGADSGFYEPTREAMKRVCAAWGIDTPGYVMIRDEGDVERAAQVLRFPLIVKHPNSYASAGLTRESKVADAGQLCEQVRLMVDDYGGAMVEEFVEGREATVLVVEAPEGAGGALAYEPIAYDFPEGETFKHYHLKWEDYDGLSAKPVEDRDLADRLKRASVDFFLGLGGAGYGRCDLRIDGEGRCHMLEINPNCGVYYPPTDPGSADLILLAEPEGHRGFTDRIVRAALARRARRDRPCEVLMRPGGDHGLFATRALSPGETVLRFEERPHTLVSRSRVEAEWGERDRDWFRRYAWPLTDEVWVTWSRDPGRWMPVNHSCEPSAWLDGLDVVARRPLESGDEVTLDYATYCNEVMPDFECSCGAETCRGTIRGEDHLADFVARYGDHVSDYVRRKRNGGR